MFYEISVQHVLSKGASTFLRHQKEHLHILQPLHLCVLSFCMGLCVITETFSSVLDGYGSNPLSAANWV